MLFPIFHLSNKSAFQENFMVTVDGRLVHVDFGWALGKEPLDAMLIHFAVQGWHPGWPQANLPGLLHSSPNSMEV